MNEMSTLQFTLTIIQIITSVVLIAVVLLQSGKRAGLSGAIAGAADAFMSKNQARSWDARLAKATKWIAVIFISLTISLNLFF
ncbi:MAG: preprotein translocase subunit SecG [Oscillospiraceae bacterium]|nr:preprotein translocase subunit SecG [Oscillospiraceae bacterium]